MCQRPGPSNESWDRTLTCFTRGVVLSRQRRWQRPLRPRRMLRCIASPPKSNRGGPNMNRSTVILVVVAILGLVAATVTSAAVGGHHDGGFHSGGGFNGSPRPGVPGVGFHAGSRFRVVSPSTRFIAPVSGFH